MIFVLVYVLATKIVLSAVVSETHPRPWRGSLVPTELAFIGLLVTYVVEMARGLRWRPALIAALEPARCIGALLLLNLSALFFNAFSHYKGSIPLFRPFQFDVALAELDLLLHGGRHPWEWLQPILGSTTLTAAMDWVYYAWFVVLLATVVAWAWHADSAKRARFFLAYFGTWALLGSVLATALSSAGPCYYSAIGLDNDPYVSLMAYLGEVDAQYPLTALRLQSLLWEGYATGHSPEGISAMPSLHVAVPVLFTLAAGKTLWRWAFAAFAVVTFLGSIHLGWHYAVDGYVAVLGAAVVWWASGGIVAAFTRSRTETAWRRRSPRSPEVLPARH